MHNLYERLTSRLALLCLLAIVIRLIWIFLIPVIPISDSVAYDVFAQNIWQHGVYGWTPEEPTSYWPVGLSGIYSGFYYLFGHTYWPISLFNITCNVAVIIFSKLLCDRFFENRNIGLITAAILALWPTLIFFSSVLASELPYMAFLLAGFYFFTSPKKSLLVPAIVGGVLFAIAYYIRPLATIPLAIGVFYLLLNHSDRRIVVFRSLISIFIVVIAVAPWAKRNYELYGAVVPMSTNSGATFWMGNQPETDGGYKKLPEYVKDMDEYTRNNTLKADAMEYIKAEPVEFVLRTIRKFMIFHFHETIGVTWNEKGLKSTLGDWSITPLKLLTQAYWSMVLLLSIAGIIILIRLKGFWQTAFHPYLLLWMSTAGVHALIVSQDRYHIPVVPMIAAFAALSINYYLQHKQESLEALPDNKNA